jgi:hypothetical protein
MTASGSFRKRKGLLLVVLFIVFAAFAANAFDLREELNILSSPYSDPDDNVTAGLVNGSAVALQPLRLLGFLQPRRTPEISSVYHHLPCGLRAPPLLS